MASSARVTKLAALAAACTALVGCSGSSGRHATTAASRAATASTPRDRWGAVWLCRPGLRDSPCSTKLTTTVVARDGRTHVVRAAPTRKPSVDCFYVYPTVSGQATVNANLAIELRERAVAIAQASRFSQVCAVYAPVYRQITLSALEHPGRITRADALVAYDSVLSSFHDYLAHYNRGRGIVFIGHSQGAAILIELLRREVDREAPVRRRLVSALLLGGNVTVKKGRDVGGDFTKIPACRSSTQTGCVVAYSSFTAKPPPGSQFGRTTSDAGVSLLSPRRPTRGLEILCVNPGSPAGGRATLDPMLPAFALAFLPAGRTPTVRTPWVSFAGEYSARCESSGDATWLQVTRSGGRADRRPRLARLEDPALGLHVLDVNIALGNLVRLVRAQAAAYRSR
jgi:DUF3089 family protein